MATKVRIIKTKSFKVEDVEHFHYSVAYKSRVFGVNTLNFKDEDDALKVEDDMLTINCSVELRKRVVVDDLDGSSKTYVDIVPKLDLALGEF